MALTGIWNRVTGGIVALAGARAASDAVNPAFETTKQRAWGRRAVRVFDPATAAAALAQELESPAHLAEDAKRHGLGATRFDILTKLAYTFPGLAELDDLTNRGIITNDQADAVLTRLGYPEPWRTHLIALFKDKLSPATVANAVQQGHMPNDGVLPDIDPTIAFPAGYRQPPAPDDAPPSSVPLTTIPLDPVEEAAAAGLDLPRLKVEANLSGLPPGPAELLAMWNRNLIDQDAVDAGIREGHMKTKWAHAFKRMRWAVLSAPEYAGLWLRGWITKAEAERGGALTGTTPEQMDLLYKNRGRPMAPTQAYTAWARDAPHPVGEGLPPRAGTFDFEDFKAAIQRSDIRTEYVEPLWHNRWAYPSLFQLGRLASAGALREARVRTILKYQRYEQQDIDSLVTFWYGGTGVAADGHVTKAQVQLWGTTHRTFIAGESNDADARARFDALGIPADAQTAILALWESERELIRKQLTPAQIKKAFEKMSRNYATGAAWTRDDALAALVARGYSVTEANDFLDIPPGK